MTPETYFAAQARIPLVWGETECAHTADGWLVANGLPSAITGSEYDFGGEAEAEALLGRLPLPIMVARVMRRAGYAVTCEPQVGDIAVIFDGFRFICAVKGERLWLFRSERGIGSAGQFARVMCAWRTGTGN